MQGLHIGSVLLAAGLLSLAACSSSSNSTNKDGPGATLPDGPPVCLGSKYPGAASIDPDNPDFEDALTTKAEVQKKFAAAKATNDPAYLAYKAALGLTNELECAFCDCGCAPLQQHKSAADCFRDMHGFG